MIKNDYLYTEDYSQRLIIRRVFLDRLSMTGEKLLLLCYLMNEGQKATAKKSLANLSGGYLRFRCYSYAGGYVFEGRLYQSEAKGLHYFLSNPYKKASLLFNEIFETGFTENEKVLALCKDRLLEEYRHHNEDSLSSSLSELDLIYTFPEINVNLVHSMTIDDERLAFRAVKEATCGQYLYIGKSRNGKDPLAEQKAYTTDFSNLPYNYDVSSRDLYSTSFLNETLTFLLSHDALESEKDYQNLLAGFESLRLALVAYMKKNYNTEIRVTFRPISKIKSIFAVTVERNKLHMIQTFLATLFEENCRLDVTPYVDKAIETQRLSATRLAGDFALAVDKMLSFADFSIPYTPDSFFAKPELTNEEVLSGLKKLKKVFVLNALYDKGE